MKIDNKQILITLIIVAIAVLSIYTISVKGALTPGEGGNIVLMDRDISSDDPAAHQEKSFTTYIYLPGDNCEASVTYCSYAYESGVDTRADVNHDGKIDLIDLLVTVRTFSCTPNKDCWNEPIEDCYFVIGGRKFKDPTTVKNYPNVDCLINASDIEIWKNGFGKKTSAYCELSNPITDECASDVNKDGKVDMYDVAIMLSKINQYADRFERYVEKGGSQADINKDSKVDMSDIGIVANSFGKSATEQLCQTKPLTHVSGQKYAVDVSGL
ncbi:MAG: dockerin type I domain-containing protein, partial [Candidatus Aenigmatarchaeota archaeon]